MADAVSPGVADDQARSVYTPSEQAGDTRQAQQGFTNDTPVDVNPNAVLARGQTLIMAAVQSDQAATVGMAGRNFEANQMRFNGLMTHFGNLLAAAYTPVPSGLGGNAAAPVAKA
jgi:hypothetical protein